MWWRRAGSERRLHPMRSSSWSTTAARPVAGSSRSSLPAGNSSKLIQDGVQQALGPGSCPSAYVVQRGVVVDLLSTSSMRSRWLAFPTNARTKLRTALESPWVAFEVDGLEPNDSGGWSVVVIGRAEEILDIDEIE